MRVSDGGNGKLAHDRSQHIGVSSMKGPGVDIIYSSGCGPDAFGRIVAPTERKMVLSQLGPKNSELQYMLFG